LHPPQLSATSRSIFSVNLLAKFKFFWKSHANLPDTLVILTCAPEYFQMLPEPPCSYAECSHTLQEYSPVPLEAPAVIEGHSEYYEI